MSIWGIGNFERDDALHVLDEWLNRLIGEVRDTFACESEETLYEDFGESDIIANIDILTTLTHHYGLRPNLHPDEVEQWKMAFLLAFDRTIHRYSTDAAYIAERRLVVETTFDRLYDTVKREEV